jgi:hypothetical protein
MPVADLIIPVNCHGAENALLLAVADSSSDASGDRPPRRERAKPLANVAPLAPEALSARRAVKRARRRARRLARPAYVNTDASCRGGLAGLAYDSGALGQRIELIRCADASRAEHLALLMAMQDADRALTGPIAFRVDSTSVANMALGKKHALRDVREQIRILFKRHPDWSLVLVEAKRNRVAHCLSRRPFQEMDQKTAASEDPELSEGPR